MSAIPRKFRDLLKRWDFALFFIAATLASYLAAANVLRGAKWPDEATWAPWSIWFILILACSLFVPLYTLYKALDAHYATADKAVAERDSDLAVVTQAVVSAIADQVKPVSVNDLAASVWLCRSDGYFDERAHFYLPQTRRRSGVAWRKGKGVAGTAWSENQDISADLTLLHNQLQQLGDAEFDKLPAIARYGLTAAEVRSTREFTGICATCLFSDGAKPKIVAIFVVDYVGDVAHFGAVAQAVSNRPVSTFIGGCEESLSAAADTL